MLVGRDEERARIRRVLADARRGRSGTLVLRGEPGIGKTALLDDAARSARGMTVLRTRGVESEAELPYAGLVTLTRPVLEFVPVLPAAQAEALTAALALGPSRSADPLAVCAATLGLLSAAAERAPVLALADDAQWLDGETVQAIVFAARRIANERITILFAHREGEASVFDAGDLDTLVLAGIGADAASKLLGDRVVDAVAHRLADVTAGNPLALLELVDTLTDAQRSGVESIAEPLPVGTQLERAFGRRLGALSAPARAAVVVAAAAGDRDDVSRLEQAWSHVGVSADDVAEVERAGLMSLENGRVRFRHPLVRAAAYAGASPPDRRAAHAALAAVLDDSEDADERGWHVAFAASRHDEEAARTIECVGRRATGRSRQSALRALRCAAVLTPPGAEKTRRTIAAAHAATAAGAWDDAATLLEDDAAAAATGHLAGEVLHLRGLVAARRGGGAVAARLLERAASELATFDPERAAAAEVQAAHSWLDAGDREEAARAAERASTLTFARGGTTELAVLLARGDTTAWRGRLDEALGYWRQAAALVDPEDPEQLQIAGEALFSAGDDHGARELLHAAERITRDRAALGTLALILRVVALSELRAGDLQAAFAAAGECTALMRAIGQRDYERTGAFGVLAWIEAILGREADCRRHVAEGHALLAELGHEEPFPRAAVGLLELSLGNAEAAANAFAPTMQLFPDRLEAEVIAPRPVLPWLAEALARQGRFAEARGLLAGKLDAARRTRRPHAIAQFLRCSGVVEGDEQAFREALEWHERWPNRWERACTELCYGEFLRRHKRRNEARMQLRGAIEGFESVGARLWAERARIELRATGERARRRDVSTGDELTPQELHVARLVCTGLTNREVATRLFLSPKTIETHLGHVFRKTGVRTRAELAHRFRDSPDSIAAPAS